MQDYIISGAKIALFFNDQILVYKRDDKPNLAFANYWDLPGGGVEKGETLEACVLRELKEEFGFTIDENRLENKKIIASHKPHKRNCFFSASISQEEIDSIVFGDEGQYWQMMTVEKFITLPDGVPFLQQATIEVMDQYTN